MGGEERTTRSQREKAIHGGHDGFWGKTAFWTSKSIIFHQNEAFLCLGQDLRWFKPDLVYAIPDLVYVIPALVWVIPDLV